MTNSEARRLKLVAAGDDNEGEQEAKRGKRKAGTVHGAKETKASGNAMRLTDRDRDLLGLLVLARHLTAEQIGRLVFDGRDESALARRLRKLHRPRGHPPFISKRRYRTYEGLPVDVWSATAYGSPAALARAEWLPPLPKHEVATQTLHHNVQLNELFVALHRAAAPSGRWAKPLRWPVQWTPSDRLRIKYGDVEQRRGYKVEKIIQPDAMLELTGLGRRYFLECEMGTNTIVPVSPDKPNATLNKLTRYQQLLCAWGRSRYRELYPDGMSMEVLFLVLSQGRAASVNAAITAWQRRIREEQFLTATALTFGEAIAHFCGLLGLEVPATPERKQASREDPRVPAFQLDLLGATLREAVDSLQRARHAIRRIAPETQKQLGLKEPPYPSRLRQADVVLRQHGARGVLEG
jgi:hypothetical protein